MTSRWSASGDVPRGADYDARFERLAASGADVHGEADFVERLVAAERGAGWSVLDAGCGTGRVAVELARRGAATAGVDLDPGMLDAARRKAPDAEWVDADLVNLDLRVDGARRRFDVVVMAGNVMIFVSPGTEAAVVARLADHVVAGGRLVAGFQ
ncbi:MAG: class I SAM-dependent methyltransferase, partial [Mycobacterium sp.]|nr:class I SAM-dependent methyltransferase [Mycobacterium sp.]